MVAPRLWFEWVGTLRQGSDWKVDQIVALNVPLLPRLIVAAVIVTWGARTNRRWTVVVAAMLGAPVVWWNALAVLVAIVYVTTGRSKTPSGVLAVTGSDRHSP